MATCLCLAAFCLVSGLAAKEKASIRFDTAAKTG